MSLSFFFLQDKITFTIKAASLGQIYNGLHDLFPNPFLMIMINASYNNHYPGHIKSDKKMCLFISEVKGTQKNQKLVAKPKK